MKQQNIEDAFYILIIKQSSWYNEYERMKKKISKRKNKERLRTVRDVVKGWRLRGFRLTVGSMLTAAVENREAHRSEVRLRTTSTYWSLFDSSKVQLCL